MKSKHYLLLCFLFIIAFNYANVERFVARIPNPDPSLAEKYEKSSYDLAAYFPGRFLDIVVDAATYEKLQILHPDISIECTEQEMLDNVVSSHRDIAGYTNYNDFLTMISSLQAQYPGMLRVQSIGDSWGKIYTEEGYSYYNNYQHEVIAIMLSDNADTDEDEPAFYFMGAHHAREPISTEVCLSILNHLLQAYATDTRISDMVDSSEIWFIPIVNPDGHKIVLGQTDIWWRKNIRDNNNSHTFNHDEYGYGLDGVDLNRNYGFEWGYTSATDDLNAPTYHGANPFSEPETIAVRDFLETRHFLAGISYHSYGEMVLYPYGYVSSLYAPDSVELSALAIYMAQSIPGQDSAFYNPMPSFALYPAAGSTDDWAYGHHGIFAYTIELAIQFIPPASQVPLITQNNLEAAKRLLERKNRACLSGHVYDAISGEPISATIYVEGIDDGMLDRAAYKSNVNFGSYYRFLPEGEYTVHYYAEAYVAEQRNVTIFGDQVSLHDIAMQPSVVFPLEIYVYDDGGLPISGATVSFPETNIADAVTDEMGMLVYPEWQGGSYRIRITKDTYESLEIYRHFLTPHIIFTLMSVPLLWDDFENGVSAWERTGNWNISTAQSVSGTKSLSDSPSGNYAGNASSYAKYTNPINLEGILFANLQFQIRHNVVLDGDYLALQISLDQVNWQTIDYFTGVSDWSLKSYPLNAYIGQNLWLRFWFPTNNSGSADGVYIDDFKVFMNATPVEQNSPAMPNPSVYAYPNPFGTELKLKLQNLPANSMYSIDVYNLRGQRVASVLHNAKTAEQNEITWSPKSEDGKKLANGIYFIKVHSRGKTLITKKILHLL